MEANKRREMLIKKAEERKRIEKHINKRYKQQKAEASIMLQVYQALGYVATSF
jgi:hypothetical protein